MEVPGQDVIDGLAHACELSAGLVNSPCEGAAAAYKALPPSGTYSIPVGKQVMGVEDAVIGVTAWRREEGDALFAFGAEVFFDCPDGKLVIGQRDIAF